MNIHDLTLPLSEADVRTLNVGDAVLLSGAPLFTARDAVHRYLADGNPPPCDVAGSVIYHCGPIVTRAPDGHPEIIAAGPTTSIREEPYMPELIRRFQLRGIIGKGGMGKATLEACARSGCVYFHAVGGAAQVLADCIASVEGVYLENEFGTPEALWQLRVDKMPVTVTMDAHGNSLHQGVEKTSGSRYRELLRLQDVLRIER